MKKATKVLVSAIIILILLSLIGTFLAKEGSMFLFLIRLAVGLSLITILMSAFLGGIPYLMSEKCPNCKSLNSFSTVEEIVDNRLVAKYKRCRACGHKKSIK